MQYSQINNLILRLILDSNFNSMTLIHMEQGHIRTEMATLYTFQTNTVSRLAIRTVSIILSKRSVQMMYCAFHNEQDFLAMPGMYI